MKINKILSSKEYTELSQEDLLKTFTPLLKSLAKSYGENRFEEDVFQQCALELFKRQKMFDLSIDRISFPYYIKVYLTVQAKLVRQKNIAAIYVPYTSMIKLKKENLYDNKRVISIDECIENSDYENFHNDALITYDDILQKKNNHLYTLLKIILKKLKQCDQLNDVQKGNIKKYLRDFLENGKLNKKLSDYLRQIFAGQTDMLKKLVKN